MRATIVRRFDSDGTTAETFDHVLEVVVEPVDPDNRTQAERNAQNALDAARLRAVERALQVRIDGLRMLTAGGAKRVDARQVEDALVDILATRAA